MKNYPEIRTLAAQSPRKERWFELLDIVDELSSKWGGGAPTADIVSRAEKILNLIPPDTAQPEIFLRLGEVGVDLEVSQVMPNARVAHVTLVVGKDSLVGITSGVSTDSTIPLDVDFGSVEEAISWVVPLLEDFSRLRS